MKNNIFGGLEHSALLRTFPFRLLNRGLGGIVKKEV